MLQDYRVISSYLIAHLILSILLQLKFFIHFSSFGMLICGIFVFKEKLGLHQKIGLGLLLAGLVLFFNDKFEVFKEKVVI